MATSQKWFLARPSLWTAIESVNFKDYAPRKSWVQIPYRLKFFFSGIIFTTAQVEYTLLGGSPSFTSLTAVQIHDFHMFLAVYSSLHGLIWNQHNNQFPVGSLALLLLVFFFSRPYFHYCSSRVYYCKDHFHWRMVLCIGSYRIVKKS